MAKIKVYSTPVCIWCRKLEDFLTEKNIEFEKYDVSIDIDARNEMVQKSGQMGVPVIDIDGTVIVGFDRAAIESALEKKEAK